MALIKGGDAIPAELVRNVTRSYCEAGTKWLNELPCVIEDLEKEWSITIGRTFENVSYNYVSEAEREDGSRAVFKIGPPQNSAGKFGEAAYLEYLDGDSAVRLLMSDSERHAMLIERIKPGLNLKEAFKTRPQDAVEAAVDSLSRIARPVPVTKEFESLDVWMNELRAALGSTFPRQHAEKAIDHFRANSEIGYRSLIHGDLHHENILLSGEDRFVVIDPKGVVGHIGYDIAVFLNNHHWWIVAHPHKRELLNDAVGRFAEAFEIDPHNVRKWAYSQMVLSAYWTFEENQIEGQRQLALADIWNV
jgi:streptomycin 6-kinase